MRSLRPACSRSRTFFWMLLTLAGLCCRADHAGVSSFVRVLNFSGKAYHRFLHLCHSSGLHLETLTACWLRLCLSLFRPFEVNARLVFLADGIKAPKEGRKMPGVKRLHQQSASNSKPEYIMGHSMQAISMWCTAPPATWQQCLWYPRSTKDWYSPIAIPGRYSTNWWPYCYP